VVLERIRSNEPVRKMLSRCGTFAANDPEIDPGLLRLIDNENLQKEGVIMPRIV